MSNEKFIFCFKITISWNHYLIGLVFLFIIRIRFPRGKSIADIIRNRYGEAFVKKIRRFKKCDFKLRKCHLDLRFLLDCKKSGVIPKFLRFKLANRHLNNSHVYRKCQLRLLEEEIKSKRKRINTLENDRGLRKNYKEHFLYYIFLIFVLCF